MYITTKFITSKYFLFKFLIGNLSNWELYLVNELREPGRLLIRSGFAVISIVNFFYTLISLNVKLT